MITPCSYVVTWRVIQIEDERVVVEARTVLKYEACKGPKALADPIKLGLGIRELEP
jgi:hypothetical protein